MFPSWYLFATVMRRSGYLHAEVFFFLSDFFHLLHDCQRMTFLSVLLDFLFVLGSQVEKLLSARAVDRIGKLLLVAMLALCVVVDILELQHVRVALLIELFGRFDGHSTILLL